MRKYMRGAIIEKFFGELEFRSEYIYIYIYIKMEFKYCFLFAISSYQQNVIIAVGWETMGGVREGRAGGMLRIFMGEDDR